MQKRRKRYSFFVLLMMLTLILLGTSALAEGLTVEATPDKESYQFSEKAVIQVKVTNESDWTIMNLEVKNEIPESFHYCDGYDGTRRFAELAQGETAEFSFAIEADDVMMPQTGDFSHPVLWIILIGVSVFGCICLSRRGSRNGWLCVLALCAAGVAQNLLACIPTAGAMLENEKTVETLLIFNEQPVYVSTHFSWEVDERTPFETLSNLNAAQDFIALDEQDEIIFSVEAGTEGTADIYLINEAGVRIAEMHDDGRDGDAAAGDGVYACTIRTDKKQADRETYYAQSGTVKSNEVTLCFYEQMDSASYQAYVDICDQIAKLEEPYLDAQGCVKAEHAGQAIQTVKQYIQNLYDKKIVLKMAYGSNSVSFWMYDKLMVNYMPHVDEVSAADKPEAIYVFESMINDSDLKFCNKSEQPEEAAEFIRESYDISFSKQRHHFEKNEVTLEVLKSCMQNDSIILFAGHGVLYEEEEITLATGLVTGERMTADSRNDYYDDIIWERICVDTENQWIILPAFIDKYCDLNNSFVYIASCYSGYLAQESSIAKACLDNGAAAFAGYDWSVAITYSRNVLSTVLQRMCEVNYDCNEYYSLEQAAEYAKDKHKRDQNHPGGQLVTYVKGGEEYYIDQKPVETKKMATIEGRIIDTNGNVINSTVPVRLYNANQTELLETFEVAGEYIIDGIEAGEYYIWFGDENDVQSVNGCASFGYLLSLENGDVWQVENIVITDFHYDWTDSTYESENINDKEIEIRHYSQNGKTSCVIPSRILGVPITEMGNYMFAGDTVIESVELPFCIKTMGSFVFSGCTSLNTVIMPKNLEVLGEHAFSRCESLETLDLPKGLTRIEPFTFNRCINLSEIYIPSSVTYIDEDAFFGCSDFTIVGEAGSYAQQYANENGFKFQAME